MAFARRARILLAAVLVFGGGPAAQAAVADTAVRALPPSTDPATAAQLGRQAYDYGLPLLEFLRVRAEMTSVRCPDLLGDAPVNSFSNVPVFADPTERTVVAPNTDTLYSIAHLDLGAGPIVLRHPAMGNRYYSFAMLDPFTNVIATPGSREDGGAAAAIVVTWAGHPRGGNWPIGARVVSSPSRRVWVIGRTLATDTADQKRAYALMRQYSLTDLQGRRPVFARECTPGTPKPYPVPTDGAGYIAALNSALTATPPPSRDAPLLRQLRPYGIGPGLSPDKAGLDPATLQALYASIAAEATALPYQFKTTAVAGAAQHQGWYLPPSDIGDYGTDYSFRAQIALGGLGANTPAEAIYPTGLTDGNGVPYDGTNRYQMIFAKGQEPPSRFFWSLTMYDFNGYLVDNAAHRFSVGPSHPPLVRRSDGSIVIAIQTNKPTDPTVNWLPAPSGQFRLNLRLYGPSKAAIDGTWRPPGVTNLGPTP